MELTYSERLQVEVAKEKAEQAAGLAMTAATALLVLVSLSIVLRLAFRLHWSLGLSRRLDWSVLFWSFFLLVGSWRMASPHYSYLWARMVWAVYAVVSLELFLFLLRMDEIAMCLVVITAGGYSMWYAWRGIVACGELYTIERRITLFP